MRWIIQHWATLEHLNSQAILFHVLAMLVCVCGLALAQWELSIRSVALVRFSLGSQSTYLLTYTYARRRKWAAVLIYNAAAISPVIVLVFWSALAGLFVYTAHGRPVWQALSPVFFFFDGLALTLTVCWSLLFSALSFSVLSCEDVPLKVVFKRTYELCVRYLWRGGSYMVLLSITLFAFTLAVDLPLMTVSLVDSWQHGFSAERATYNAPIYLQVMGVIWDTVINILLVGIALVADGFYYNDLRLRMEGRDLLSRLDRLKLQLPSNSKS